MSHTPRVQAGRKIRNSDGTDTWVETRFQIGYQEQRTVTATPWTETFRETCFCCSCPPDGYTKDVYCRNHGFAGTRRCEVHNMPGTGKANADYEDNYHVDLEKLHTVQQCNERARELYPEYYGLGER